MLVNEIHASINLCKFKHPGVVLHAINENKIINKH